jgi:hypothetical protein
MTSFLDKLQPTPVFATYWKFAAERHAIYLKRLKGEPPPWSADSTLQAYKFTNPFRAADRTSQVLIELIYSPDLPSNPEEVVFRVLLFKLFNKIETWQLLATALGPLTWKSFDYAKYPDALDAAKEHGQTLFNGAYIQNQNYRTELGAKHRSYLALLEYMMRDGVTGKLRAARTYEQAYQVLWSYPLHGDFIAMQHACDLNYSPINKLQ